VESDELDRSGYQLNDPVKLKYPPHPASHFAGLFCADTMGPLQESNRVLGGESPTASPLCLSYCRSVGTIISMAKALTPIEKLQQLIDIENKLIKHEIDIKGIDFTFWTKPTTISKYKAAKAASKDPEDLLETTARLFIKNALDESGRPQFQIDALPLIMGQLSMTSASKLMGAMNSDEEEEVETDLKSTED
jgi:hypothetical protein